MGKIGRNQPCTCGSGEKYKKCCRTRLQEEQHNSNAIAHVGQLLRDGKLPFRAEITSDGGTPSSMMVTSATMTDEHGVVHQIFDDGIALSVGGNGPSKAILEVPVQTEKIGRIETVGDAKVVNGTEYYNVSLNKKKKLSAKSQNGLFASVKTQRQRDIDADVCHIFFGEKGKAESIDRDGKKDRPHICLASTGKGLYSRLASYKCSIANRASYERQLKTISIDSVLVTIEDWNERLKVCFNVDHSTKRVIITNVGFLSVN